jgi:hypothetical protein
MKELIMRAQILHTLHILSRCRKGDVLVVAHGQPQEQERKSREQRAE